LLTPAAVVGDHERCRRAFVNAQHQIVTRIRLFLSLPLDKLDRLSLQTQLRELGDKASIV
jgi:arsenate reductase